MKQTLEKLWNEYLSDECAEIDTDEERKLTKKTVELHEKANSLLKVRSIILTLTRLNKMLWKNMLKLCTILKHSL